MCVCVSECVCVSSSHFGESVYMHLHVYVQVVGSTAGIDAHECFHVCTEVCVCVLKLFLVCGLVTD